MVVRTGLNTTVGNMLRPLLHSHWARKHLRSFMGFHREVDHLSTMPYGLTCATKASPDLIAYARCARTAVLFVIS